MQESSYSDKKLILTPVKFTRREKILSTSKDEQSDKRSISRGKAKSIKVQ